jgi:hypothetical protein
MVFNDSIMKRALKYTHVLTECWVFLCTNKSVNKYILSLVQIAILRCSSCFNQTSRAKQSGQSIALLSHSENEYKLKSEEISGRIYFQTLILLVTLRLGNLLVILLQGHFILGPTVSKTEFWTCKIYICQDKISRSLSVVIVSCELPADSRPSACWLVMWFLIIHEGK